MVGDDHVRAGAEKGSQYLAHGAPLVQPAFLCRRLDHGIFAADVVDADRKVCARAQSADDVEIGQGGLDHEDIRPFRLVRRRFAQRLSPVAAVHLIALAVAVARGGLRRVAEGPVEGGGELGAVAHDRHLRIARAVQLFADGRHHPVHHRRGRHHICPRAHRRQRRRRVQGEGCVVVHIPRPVQRPAVAVRCVFAQADVGDEQGALAALRKQRPQGADGAGHDALFVGGAAARLVLVFGDAEQQNAAYPRVQGGVRRLAQAVDGIAVHARHGGDLFLHVLPPAHEQRPDELFRADGRLRHQIAQQLRAARPSQSLHTISSDRCTAHTAGTACLFLKFELYTPPLPKRAPCKTFFKI